MKEAEIREIRIMSHELYRKIDKMVEKKIKDLMSFWRYNEKNKQ